MYQRALAVIKC